MRKSDSQTVRLRFLSEKEKIEVKIEEIYKYEVNTIIFPTLNSFIEAHEKYEIFGKKVNLIREEIKYNLDIKILEKINSLYNDINLLEIIGGQIFMRTQDREYFKNRIFKSNYYRIHILHFT